MKEREKDRRSSEDLHARPVVHSRVKMQERLSPVQNPLFNLQQSVGNQGVQSLLHSHAAQPKLRVSQPGDADEVEADRMADQIVTTAPPAVHHNCACEGSGTPRSTCEEEKLAGPKGIRRGGNQTSGENESVGGDFLQSLGPGQPLDTVMRNEMEAKFGRDFKDVRVHHDTQSAGVARSINARAFTSGRNVVFAANQYAPHTSAGKKLLAHELAHVVQQSSSRLFGGSVTPATHTVQRQTPPTGGPPALPPWLQGVKITRHVSGNVYEINLTGYGPTEVGPFSELTAYLAAQGRSAKEHAHHIVGREHLRDVPTAYNESNAPSVALENGTHNAVSTRITSVQNELGGRRGGRPVVSRQEIAALYREVYTVDTQFKELSTISNNVLGTPVKPPTPGGGPGKGGGGPAKPASTEPDPTAKAQKALPSTAPKQEIPPVKSTGSATAGEILESEKAVSQLRSELSESVRFSGRVRFYAAAFSALLEAIALLDTIGDALKMGTEGTVLGPAQRQAEKIEDQSREAVQSTETLAESLSLFAAVVNVEKAQRTGNTDALFALSNSLGELSTSLQNSIATFNRLSRDLDARARAIDVMRDLYEKMVSLPMGPSTAPNAQAFAMAESLQKLHGAVNSAAQNYAAAAANLSAYADGFGSLASQASRTAWQIILGRIAKAQAEKSAESPPPQPPSSQTVPLQVTPQRQEKKSEPCPNCHRPNEGRSEPSLIERFGDLGTGPGGQMTEEDRKRLLEFIRGQ